jgi:hypothetical protein
VKYGGSMLWATMIFFLAAMAAPSLPRQTTALIAALIAVGVELFRLVHTPWLDAFRLTLAGALPLGRIFSLWDMLAYGAGILPGVLLDRAPSLACFPLHLLLFFATFLAAFFDFFAVDFFAAFLGDFFAAFLAVLFFAAGFAAARFFLAAGDTAIGGIIGGSSAFSAWVAASVARFAMSFTVPAIFSRIDLSSSMMIPKRDYPGLTGRRAAGSIVATSLPELKPLKPVQLLLDPAF